MSFTRAEILDDIEEVQYYGRKPPVVWVQEFLERKWWLAEGYKSLSPKPILELPACFDLKVVSWGVKQPKEKVVRFYRIETCAVKKTVCPRCGGPTEVREGSPQVIHIGSCRSPAP